MQVEDIQRLREIKDKQSKLRQHHITDGRLMEKYLEIYEDLGYIKQVAKDLENDNLLDAVTNVQRSTDELRKVIREEYSVL